MASEGKFARPRRHPDELSEPAADAAPAATPLSETPLDALLRAAPQPPSRDQLEFAEIDTPLPRPAAKTEATPPAPAPSGADLLANLRFLYRPIWDPARNVVSAYLAFAQVLSADRQAALGDGATATQGHIEERALLDERLVDHVLDDLDGIVREERRLLVCLPVHFETLAAPARRRRYGELLQARIDDGKRELLLIEIEGVPVGAPQSRLIELMVPLRPHCRALMLGLPLETADFVAAKGTGALALGCDIAGHAGPEFVLMQQMNRFARGARERAGLPSYLHGAKSLSLVAAALGAGFGRIDGEAVAKPIGHPRGTAELRLDDLYRPVIAS